MQRATGTTDKGWEIVCEPAEKRYNDGLAEMRTNPNRGFPKALYARGWSRGGGREFEKKLDNDKLGLKPEDLDAVTKKLVEKVQSGWNPWVEWWIIKREFNFIGSPVLKLSVTHVTS